MLAAAAFFLSFSVSLAGAWCISRAPLLREKSMVEPQADRWHQRATPGWGGIAIFCAHICGIAVSGILFEIDVYLILAPALLLFIIGVFDDVHPMRPQTKLLSQVLAVVLFLASQVLTGSFPLGGFALAVIWLLAIINGANLLDNMDGLAGGIAFIAAVSIALISVSTGDIHAHLLFVSLAGALAGFLVLNVNPAKLFMGDSGSLWIGLLIGSGSLMVSLNLGIKSDVGMYSWFVPLLICVVPVLDTTAMCITRTLRGQSIAQGGRDHLSHRLVARGLSERVSVIVLWLISLGGAMCAWQFFSMPVSLAMSISIVYLVCCALFAIWLCAIPYQQLTHRKNPP